MRLMDFKTANKCPNSLANLKLVSQEKPISNTFNRGFDVKIFLKLNEYKKIKLKPIQLNGIENIW